MMIMMIMVILMIIDNPVQTLRCVSARAKQLEQRKVRKFLTFDDSHRDLLCFEDSHRDLLRTIYVSSQNGEQIKYSP